MIEWREHYPHSLIGKVRTWWHRLIKGCVINTVDSIYGGLVVFDDTCQDAWWS